MYVMSSKFAVKKISCASYTDVLPRIQEAELNWLTSLLSRANVPKIMIDKALTDEDYGKVAWREYLFDTHGLIIIKNISSHKVVITKVNTETSEKTVLGEWLKPEIVKVQGEGKVSYDINLKYWQII